jgi:hypothetical protein
MGVPEPKRLTATFGHGRTEGYWQYWSRQTTHLRLWAYQTSPDNGVAGVLLLVEVFMSLVLNTPNS